uniref:Uncharacterized protein n=1 Tax=Romanomermis culicivorax TaxID=13658 RepID=A0A915HGT9_ROMCU
MQSDLITYPQQYLIAGPSQLLLNILIAGATLSFLAFIAWIFFQRYTSTRLTRKGLGRCGEVQWAQRSQQKANNPGNAGKRERDDGLQALIKEKIKAALAVGIGQKQGKAGMLRRQEDMG